MTFKIPYDDSGLRVRKKIYGGYPIHEWKFAVLDLLSYGLSADDPEAVDNVINWMRIHPDCVINEP